MSFRKGFFRLWIAASALWILTIAFLFFQNAWDPIRDNDVFVFDLRNESLTATGIQHYDFMKADDYADFADILIEFSGSDFPNENFPKYHFKDFYVATQNAPKKDDVSKIIHKVHDYYEAEKSLIRRKLLKEYTVAAIGIPIGVLAFGVGIAWVLAGFRGEKRS